LSIGLEHIEDIWEDLEKALWYFFKWELGSWGIRELGSSSSPDSFNLVPPKKLIIFFIFDQRFLIVSLYIQSEPLE
jgi:hypothetical protein